MLGHEKSRLSILTLKKYPVKIKWDKNNCKDVKGKQIKSNDLEGDFPEMMSHQKQKL